MEKAPEPLATVHWQYEPEPKQRLGSFACCAMRQKPERELEAPPAPERVIWDTADLTWWDFQRRRWKTLWRPDVVAFRCFWQLFAGDEGFLEIQKSCRGSCARSTSATRAFRSSEGCETDAIHLAADLTRVVGVDRGLARRSRAREALGGLRLRLHPASKARKTS